MISREGAALSLVIPTRVSHFALLATTTCAALRKESRMQIIKATGLDRKSGGPKWSDLQCALRLSPILPRRTNPQSNPYPQPDFAIPGGNSRLSNKINPTDSTNQLIWTALIFSRPFGTCAEFFRSLFGP